MSDPEIDELSDTDVNGMIGATMREHPEGGYSHVHTL